MSLRLERAEQGEERAGGGEQEGVMCLPAEPSPWTGLSLGTGTILANPGDVLPSGKPCKNFVLL